MCGGMTEEQTQSKKSSLLDGWNAPPNLVTYCRIVLVVVFLGLYIAAGAWGVNSASMRWAAAIVFIIAASTDKLDGWMARKYNQVTELGKLMDPIADKLMTCGALVVASVFAEFPWWATILFLIREIGITVMRFFVIDHGGKVIAASQIGKYKTLAQCLGIGLLMFPVWTLWHGGAQPLWLSIYFVVTYMLIYFSLILCLYSGWQYVHGVMAAKKRAAR